MRRRDFLCAGAAFLASPALAQNAPLAALQEYERSCGGHIGVYAENLRTGTKLTWRADERFVMCSTFKASLAACILSHVDRGEENLEHSLPFSAADIQDWHAPIAKANVDKGKLSIREMCRAAVAYSDNTCANILLARIGGPAALTTYWRGLGDEETRLDDPEPYLNRTPLGGLENTTTPSSMAHILRKLTLEDALSAQSRQTLIGWLIESQTGFNRLRAGLPRGWVVGDKTGNNGADAAGDIAIVWPNQNTPIIISAYTRGGTPTPAQFQTVFTGIGRYVGEKLV